ncbi:MAG: acetylglutamate kinase, partial [Akkermansiaceae bacterium]
MSLDTTINKAAVLIEALPYLQSFRGHTFLIKMGGSAMENPELVRKVMRDIVFMEVAGINPVVVHGGGKAISAAMQESGLAAEFIGGFRVTTPEAISIVEQTLSGKINPGLVEMLAGLGGKAVGIPGTNVFVGRRIQAKNDEGKMVDIGRVGEAVACQLETIQAQISSETVPVISPLAAEEETGKPLNVNADLAAACL